MEHTQKTQGRIGAPTTHRSVLHTAPRRNVRSGGPTHHRTTHRRNEMPLNSGVVSGEHSKTVKFTPLGGLEEVGRNMSVFEYENEIVIVDMGLQFPEEETPGIDFIIPNITSLIPKKKNIKGIIITHGHFDHIGAIPYLVSKLGNDIPIYTAAFSKAIISKRQDEFNTGGKLHIIVVKPGEKIKISEHFNAEFFDADHTIPDSLSVILHTPVGNMVYCSDLKITRDIDGNPHHTDLYKYVGDKDIHTLFLESTNAWKPGKSVSEETVIKNLDDFFVHAKGRIIIGLFSSLITRVVDIFRLAEKHGRKIVLSGFSLKNNVQIAQNLGYLRAKKDTIVPMESIHKYKDENILVLSTGAQGEARASLNKIVSGENKNISIKKGDTIIFSSSVIPGNERPIQTLKDNLTRQGARVYQTQHIDIHASGHGPAEDLKLVIQLVKPKFFVPIHGMYFMRAANADLAQETGVPEQNTILLDNGQVLALTPTKATITHETVPTSYVMVDGLGVGDVEEVVVRDRVALSQEGMFIMIVTLDRRTGRFLKNPDIISRGFIYLKENKDIIEEVRKKIKSIIGRIPHFQSVEPDYLKSLLRDQVGQYIYRVTKRRPMIIPVIIEV